MYESVLGKVDAMAAALGLGRESHRVLPGENPWGYSGGLEQTHSSMQEEETSLSSSIEKNQTVEDRSARSSLTLFENEKEKEKERAGLGRK